MVTSMQHRINIYTMCCSIPEGFISQRISIYIANTSKGALGTRDEKSARRLLCMIQSSLNKLSFINIELKLYRYDIPTLVYVNHVRSSTSLWKEWHFFQAALFYFLCVVNRFISPRAHTSVCSFCYQSLDLFPFFFWYKSHFHEEKAIIRIV